MKKVLAAILVSVVIVTALSSCEQMTAVAYNKDYFDTTYHFEKAIVSLPNGEIIEGKVDSWTDYENSDQIQVKINGITYLVHSSNVVLIAED